MPIIAVFYNLYEYTEWEYKNLPESWKLQSLKLMPLSIVDNGNKDDQGNHGHFEYHVGYRFSEYFSGSNENKSETVAYLNNLFTKLKDKGLIENFKIATYDTEILNEILCGKDYIR